jgi:hypothetical protein
MEPNIKTTICPQCGTIHPPLKPGQICPLVEHKDKYGETIQINDGIVDIKNLVLKTIKNKALKDHNKLMIEIIENVKNFLNDYKE